MQIYTISLILFKTQGLSIIINDHLTPYISIKFSPGGPSMWTSQELLKKKLFTPLLLLPHCILSPQAHGRNENFH